MGCAFPKSGELKPTIESYVKAWAMCQKAHEAIKNLTGEETVEILTNICENTFVVLDELIDVVEKMKITNTFMIEQATTIIDTLNKEIIILKMRIALKEANLNLVL